MRFFRLTVAVLLASLALAGTSSYAAEVAASAEHQHSLYHHTAYKVKEFKAAPQQWRHDSSVQYNKQQHHVDLQIAVKRQNLEQLHQTILQVSDPKSKQYGKYLQKHEVDALVAPSAESVQHVRNWLQAHNVDLSSVKTSANGDMLKVSLPVNKVESLLNTQYRTFRHQHSDRVMVRATEYQLPAVLHEHIDTIQPTTSFASQDKKSVDKQARLKAAHLAHHHQSKHHVQESSRRFHAKGVKSLVAPVPAAGTCNTTQTLGCVRTIYNALGYNATQATNGKNSMAFAEFLGEAANQNDLDHFLQAYRPEAVGATYTLVQVNQNLTVNPSQTDKNAPDIKGESDLDVQFILGVAWPTPLTVFSTAGEPPFIQDAGTPTNTNEPYLTYTTFILNQTTLPNVISHSYGDDEQSVPQDYAERVCSDFATLAARGVSIIFSSGDAGVANTECVTLQNTTAFIPAFPASCPWVTTVGATKGLPEQAVTRFKSGSGFSNYFPQPSYQATAVENYITHLNGSVDQSLWNASGRAYPDVAAYGNYDYIYYNVSFGERNGGNVTIGGTSASAPTFAGFVALLNDYRISMGLPTMGFLNPFLYQFGYLALNDITVGDSDVAGCAADGVGSAGFPTATGWDPVTGWGTPNFVKLQSASILAQQGSAGY